MTRETHIVYMARGAVRCDNLWNSRNSNAVNACMRHECLIGWQTCAPLWGARYLAGCAGYRQAPGARGAPTRGGRGQIFQLLKSLKAQFAYQIQFPIAK